MIKRKAHIWLLLLAAQSGNALADDDKSSWYIGGGLGITELDPDTGNTGYMVSDEKDTGIKLFAGYDFTEKFSVEGFYSDLGTAKVSSDFVTLPDGDITYSTIGASALWYFWRNNNDGDESARKGLSAYLHGGLSFLDNSSSGVNYTQNNSTQITYGAALEYGFSNGIAARAAMDLYDKDAGMVYISVLKRFGTASSRKAINDPEPVVEPVVETPAPEPVPEVIVAPVAVEPVVVEPVIEETVEVDTDNDGVVDQLDQCTDSPAEFDVDEKGCSIIELNFEGVNFEPQSFELTDESKRLLDDVVVTINASPELQKIEVQAHTDSKGPKKYNLKLSEQRAASVKDYLVSQDVSESRLVAKGYGESEPVADNNTEEGRAKNRRVELKVIRDTEQ